MDNVDKFLENLSLPVEHSDVEDPSKKRTKTNDGSWQSIRTIPPLPDYFDLESGENLNEHPSKSLNDTLNTDTLPVEQSSKVASTVWDIIDPKRIVRGLPSSSTEASGSFQNEKSANIELSCKKYGEWILDPPSDGIVPLPRLERPPGCRTVSIDGLPEEVSTNTIREIFDSLKIGQIWKINEEDSLIQITFPGESQIDQVLPFNGYKISNEKHREYGKSVIQVNFVPVREEQEEYVRRIEKRQISQKLKRKRDVSPTPMSADTECTNEAIAKLTKKIKFYPSLIRHSANLLVRWTREGKCNKDNYFYFKEALDILDGAIHRLIQDTKQLEEAILQNQEELKGKYAKYCSYFDEILKAYNAVTSKTVFNCFSPELRTKIEAWKLYIENVKECSFQDLINVQSNSWDKISMKGSMSTVQNIKSQKLKSKIIYLQAENERLEKELKVAQQEAAERTKSLESSNPDILQNECQQAKKPPEKNIKINEREARLIALIGPYLHFHRSGETTDSICRHIVKVDPEVTNEELEGLMRKFPKVFKEESVEDLYDSETKWSLLGI